ncbi:hypothetical protein FHX37_3194 [Haloactinospora alba]|uniref:Uncharacterized protein n=1 Tax=Haloactinospora alba TaxID=405555 RepID=A0A543NMZ1_9ACTN|nr:hypothetical protein [Haloactinospora alba]TQN33192.1 hypothetical protein FHX37_3194 [Haloactinospora alba]
MLYLILLLLLVWLALTVLGMVLKGLFWLTVLGVVLFLATAAWGWLQKPRP